MERTFPHPAVAPLLLAQAALGGLLLPAAGTTRIPGGLSGEWGLCLCLAFIGQVAAGLLLPRTPRLRTRLALWLALAAFNAQLICLWDINQSYRQFVNGGHFWRPERLARQNTLNLRLLAATAAGETDRVATLLERGAYTETRAYTENTDGETPLLLAIDNGDTKTARLLLDHGADPNAARDDGDEDNGVTPLFSAAGNDETAMVRLLLDRGARTNVPAKSDLDPFVFASEMGATGSVRLLLSHGVNPRGPRGDNAMVQAVFRGRTDVIALLLSHGADVNGKGLVISDTRFGNDSGWSLLMLALKRYDPDIARYLIDHGANVHIRSRQGWTALDVARRLHEKDAEKVILAAQK